MIMVQFQLFFMKWNQAVVLGEGLDIRLRDGRE